MPSEGSRAVPRHVRSVLERALRAPCMPRRISSGRTGGTTPLDDRIPFPALPCLIYPEGRIRRTQDKKHCPFYIPLTAQLTRNPPCFEQTLTLFTYYPFRQTVSQLLLLPAVTIDDPEHPWDADRSPPRQVPADKKHGVQPRGTCGVGSWTGSRR